MAMRGASTYALFQTGVIKSPLTPMQAAVIGAGLFLANKAFDKVGNYFIGKGYLPMQLTYDEVSRLSWLYGKNMFSRFTTGEWFMFKSVVGKYNEKGNNYDFQFQYLNNAKTGSGTTGLSNPKHWTSNSAEGLALLAGSVALMVFQAMTFKEALIQSFVIYATGKVGQSLFQNDFFSSAYVHGVMSKVKTTVGFKPRGIFATPQEQ